MLVGPETVTIEVAKDMTFGGPMTYRAVWAGPEAANIRSEYWAYQAAKLVSQLSPAARWPAPAVDAGLPATDPIHAGQTLYVAQCKLNRGGSSDVRPDLNRPMNPRPEIGSHLARPADEGLFAGPY
jgi:hypothetical protein